MLVHFMKMQGLGNDFVVLDRITQNIYLNKAQIQQLADRKLGIGCDQVIVVEPPIKPDHDFYYRIFNPDGSEVEQCGNGVRCAARFVFMTGLIKKHRMWADCLGGAVGLHLQKNSLVTVNLGVPKGFQAEALAIPGFKAGYTFFKVDLGNPHAVVFAPPGLGIDDLKSWDTLHEAILSTDLFPNGVNIEWVEWISRQMLRVRVRERGVGETLACGSGACAVALVARSLDKVDTQVQVHFALGHVDIQWAGEHQALLMTGPAVSVFQGRYRLY